MDVQAVVAHGVRVSLTPSIDGGVQVELERGERVRQVFGKALLEDEPVFAALLDRLYGELVTLEHSAS